MHISQTNIGSDRPTLNRVDIPDIVKVIEFVAWYLKNEPIANELNNRSNHIIYNEGCRPLIDVNNIPDITNPKIDSILKWFGVKFFYDINKLIKANQAEFKKFLDDLTMSSNTTLSTAGNIGIKYNVNYENFVYEKEIEKIPVGTERETFKANHLTDNVFGAEIRIVAWLYHDYFGDWFKSEKPTN